MWGTLFNVDTDKAIRHWSIKQKTEVAEIEP